MSRTDLMRGTLDLLILRALMTGPNHGLGIARRVEQITQGAFRVSAGSLLGAFPISRSRAHTHRRHGHPLQTVPSAGLIERPQEKNRVDALR